jgi:demethylmenaquinone methyltransferase / 2-methoxy-6-polyprenyl-1,4-benzoquinol methylase
VSGEPVSTVSKGASPAGIQGEREVSRWVRGMFDEVAPRYDLLNHVLSGNIDRYWRWRTVRQFRGVLAEPGARVLDLACGSGDLVQAMGGEGTRALRIGGDFSHGMLRAAQAKMPQLPLVEADGLQLPFADNTLDLITIGFGFRNLANYRAGCQEMLRVLRPGGRAAILEFSTPPNALFRAGYQFYSFQVLPRIGAMLAKDGAKNAYRYLPASVKKFPDAPELAALMRSAGFSHVRFERMTMGIVALHVGVKGG